MKKTVVTALLSFLISAFSGSDIVAFSKEYPLSIVAQKNGSIAEIRISGVIHQFQNSAEEFKRTIDGLIAQGIKDVRLYLNTPGGSVFEANEIANEIKRFGGIVTGFGGALVASAGSYLAIICDTFEMAENGQYMYHKPWGQITGNEGEVASGLKLLENLTNQYRTAYALKTGLSEDQIEENWIKGDVWLSAKEAADQGFITSVSGQKQKITESESALFVALGSPVVPEITKNEKKMKNRNEIIANLKLAADASDEQIATAVANAMKNSEAYSEQETQAKGQKKQLAEAMVQAFIDSKQTTADLKDNWVKMALTDYEGTKAILTAQPKAVKASEHLDAGASSETGRGKWTLQDYLDKDPKALETLAEKDPATFEKINNEHYGF